ncbi:MAG TPA: sigma-70 family RNA polymerase sigma factor [Ktedonobacteraceae bacterium]|nr:sigma-70 family RNA polymerase sigma factor [Ktedonobacteraceae bacterium]
MPSDLKNASIGITTDAGTFEAIFMRYYPLIYQLAYRCTGQQDEADDIAQEVFLRYYRVPPRATSEGERRAWLCRVATNLSLNALRAKQRRIDHEERGGKRLLAGETDLSVRDDPEQHALMVEQVDLVRSVLAELPERQQSYLLLRSIGLSYAEIAQTTGVAQASVGALLARAEREFRRKYDERIAAAQIR